MLRKLIAAVFVLGVVTIVTGASPARAQDDGPMQGTDEQNRPVSSEQQTPRQTEERKRQTTEPREQKIEMMRGKLDDSRKKTCDQRGEPIKKIMETTRDRSTQHGALFGKVAERVQEFRAKKELNVENYDKLVADVNTKKATVVTAEKALRSIDKIDCSGDDPAAKVSDFKAKSLALRQALKEYRDAVKALLKAVKAAAAQQPKTSNEGGDQ